LTSPAIVHYCGLRYTPCRPVIGKGVGQKPRRSDPPQRYDRHCFRGLMETCGRSWLGRRAADQSASGECQGTRKPPTWLCRQTVPSCDGEAADIPAAQCRAALTQERGCEQRFLSERNNVAAGWSNGRLNEDRALLAELRGSRDHARRIR